jgi:hypothetical protein
LKPTLSPKNTFLLSSYDLWKALVWLLWLRPNFSIKKKFEKTLPDPQKQLPVKLSGPLGGPGWLWWPLQPFFHFSPGRVKNPYPNPDPTSPNRLVIANVQAPSLAKRLIRAKHLKPHSEGPPALFRKYSGGKLENSTQKQNLETLKRVSSPETFV